MLEIYPPAYLDSFYNELIICLDELDDPSLEKSEHILKCCRQDLNKLFITLHNINTQFSTPNNNLSHKPDKPLIGILIEYFFFKYGTLMDHAISILKELGGLKFHKNPKHKFVYKQLRSYIENDTDKNLLKLEWYNNFRLIRNNIVHDKVSSIPFIRDQELFFQIYGDDLEESIPHDYIIECMSIENGLVNFKYYATYYLDLLLKYLRVVTKYTSIIICNKHKINDYHSFIETHQNKITHKIPVSNTIITYRSWLLDTNKFLLHLELNSKL